MIPLSRFLAFTLSLVALLALVRTPAHSQAVNTLAISNAPPSTNFVLVVMGNRLLRVPLTNAWDLIQPASATDFHDLTATNHLGFGPNVFSWRNDTGLAYLWNDTLGTAPLAIDEATDLVTIDPDLYVAALADVETLNVRDDAFIAGDTHTSGTAHAGDVQATNNISAGGDVSASAGVFSATVDAVGGFLTTGTIGGGGQFFYDALLSPASNLTNYTVTAGVAERTINATNGVHFSTVSGGASGKKYFCGVTLTNFSGADQLVTFASGWVPYGTPTNTLANGGTGRAIFEIEGTRVRYSFFVQGEPAAASDSSYAMTMAHAAHSFGTAASAVYWGPFFAATPTATPGLYRSTVPKAGTITGLSWNQHATGGSGETITNSLWLNGTNGTLIAEWAWPGNASAAYSTNISGLNQAVTAGDQIVMRSWNPSMSSAHTSCKQLLTVVIQ